MKLSEDRAVAELNTIENINVFWCYIIIDISAGIPSILENNLIGYFIFLAVIVCLMKKYFKKRNINIQHIFGECTFNSKETFGFLILLMLVNIVFRMASYYIFSYISPDKMLEYLSITDSYSLTKSTFVNIVIIVPILEELFYRGILLNRLKGSSIKRRLIISSIIFGIVHFEWFIVAGIGGYILGYVYLRTRSLTTPIILHSAVNLSAFVSRHYESETVYSIQFIRSETVYFFLIFLMLSPLYIYLFRKFWLDVKSFKEAPYIANMSKRSKMKELIREEVIEINKGYFIKKKVSKSSLNRSVEIELNKKIVSLFKWIVEECYEATIK